MNSDLEVNPFGKAWIRNNSEDEELTLAAQALQEL